MTSEPTEEEWLCPDCEEGSHMCLYCGEAGDDSLSLGRDGTVVKCGRRSCGRFYHEKCVPRVVACAGRVWDPGVRRGGGGWGRAGLG